MADVKEFIKYLESQLGSMYVLGAQGERFVSLLDRVCQMENGKISLVNNVLTLLKSKFEAHVNVEELLAYDCSGLGMKWFMQNGIFKYDMTAKGIYEQIPDSCKVAVSMNKLKPGDLLWESGLEHIGYYIGDGYAVEARGTAYGVVRTKISERKWSLAKRPKWWDGGSVKPALYRELYVTSPLMKGDDVAAVQTALNDRDFDCGTADGVFGIKTETAVKGFQKSQKLTADGIVGKNTAVALGFEWKG